MITNPTRERKKGGKQRTIETRKGSKYWKFQIFYIPESTIICHKDHRIAIKSHSNNHPFRKKQYLQKKSWLHRQILRFKKEKVKWDRILTHITKRQISDCYTLCCSRGTNFINEVYHWVMTWRSSNTQHLSCISIIIWKILGT